MEFTPDYNVRAPQRKGHAGLPGIEAEKARAPGGSDRAAPWHDGNGMDYLCLIALTTCGGDIGNSLMRTPSAR